MEFGDISNKLNSAY